MTESSNSVMEDNAVKAAFNFAATVGNAKYQSEPIDYKKIAKERSRLLYGPPGQT